MGRLLITVRLSQVASALHTRLMLSGKVGGDEVVAVNRPGSDGGSGVLI